MRIRILYVRSVKHRLPPWVVVLLLAVVCAAVIGGVAIYRGRMASPLELLPRLPADGATLVYVDFRALRAGGVLSVLSASKIGQEPEYQAFVEQTGFDYLNDLESALVSFHPTGTYFLLRGRFDWKALKDFTVSQGGVCYNTLCRVNGSTPQRKISFFPLQPNLMALAVSPDEYAVYEMQTKRPATQFDLPSEPVWVWVPFSELRSNQSIPLGAKMFVRALEPASSVLLAAGLASQGFELRMEANCRTAADAYRITNQLRDATAMLRDLILREHQTPNPGDLSGVLTAGAFETKQTQVIGRWPVDPSFLRNLAGGAL